MKLKCVLLESHNAGDEKEYNHLSSLDDITACLLTDKLELLTNGDFYVGQDDGMFFFAVKPENEHILIDVFPNENTFLIDSNDYPWDYDPSLRS